jgi:nicotinate dehydrogenase subunit B
MIENTTIEIEPERYELRDAPMYQFDLDRRDFFKFLGGGVFVVLTVGGLARAQESGRGGRRQGGESLPEDIEAWLHIGETGAVTVYTGKVEVGQGARTELTQIVAEELHSPVTSISMVMGDTDLTPYDMGTFGSRTTPTMGPQLRKVAATARELLIDMAAERWKADRASITVSNGKVVAGQQSIDFGELTKGKKLTKTISGDVQTTPASQWKIAGKPVHKVQGELCVTGKHKYASDMKLPGMLYGKVLRPPSFASTLASVDTHDAEAVAGVKIVRDGEFVGAAGPDHETAAKAVDAIKVEWKTTPQPSAAELYDYLRKNPSNNSEGNFGGGNHETGAVQTALAQADKKLQQSYTIAYIAHAPLEPRAAVAEWKDDKLTVWTGTQRPFGVRSELAQVFHIPESKVRVIMPDTGSGYGGKHTGECAIEAARLAKAAGKPVKVNWTREEEFTWAYFRPAGVIDVTSGATSDGKITAWEFHNYNSGPSGIGTMYDIPNQKIQFHPTKLPLPRQGSYRGLAATANHFAREVHMDELAHELKMEPLEFRLKNLKDPRLRAVYEAAADAFGWGKSKPLAGHGFGFGGGFEKGSYIAMCAEVAADRSTGDVKVIRVTAAFECGAIVNPDNLKNQVEGSVIMAIGGALFEAIDFENGKILNPRFSRYRVPRFGDTPAIQTILIDRKDLPSAGAGETPIVGLAPAVGNAIFAATGIRLRSLPMVPKGLKEPA